MCVALVLLLLIGLAWFKYGRMITRLYQDSQSELESMHELNADSPVDKKRI